MRFSVSPGCRSCATAAVRGLGSTIDPLLGADAPLPNLSRHSANLIGKYEYGPVAVRLAQNWRNTFPTRPQSAWLNDRQIAASLAMRL